jgi:excisionase family DNA binding protein
MTLDDDLPPILTVEQTAKLLGISRGLAFTAVRAGDIPSIRIGRRILVPRDALRRLIGDAQVAGQ